MSPLGRTRFRDEQILTVTSPGRRAHALRRIVREAILAHRTRIVAVGIGDPQVLDAAAVAEKSDRLAIGRELRLTVERHSAQNALRRSSFDRQRVDVADEIEGDRTAVRGDVERHPRALVGRELDRLRFLEHERRRGSAVALLIRSILRDAFVRWRSIW